MKKLIFLIIPFLLFLTSCKESGTEPSQGETQFDFSPQLNKVYTFKMWVLDSLENKIEPGYEYTEQCVAKNVTIGGVNDAFIRVRTNPNSPYSDTTYFRVVGGKDVYEYTDTSALFSSSESLKYQLKKIKDSYVWVPRILLSKGEGADYQILPKKTFLVPVDTTNQNYITVNVEFRGKNLGFEKLNLANSQYQAYKVDIYANFEVYFGTQKIDSFTGHQYVWINDDIDWVVKQYNTTLKSNLFGVIENGTISELIRED